MPFVLAKAGGFLATPSNLLFVLLGLGLLASWRPGALGRWGRRTALAALALIGFLGLAPVGTWLLRPLEDRFPPGPDDPGQIAGVIVLGGAIHPNISFGRGQLQVGESAERVITLADLAQRRPEARIVFTGGSGALIGDHVPEADALIRFAPTLGLDPARVTLEGRSRTTAENATETRRLLDPKPGEHWLLVTSAWHMPRAIGAFRAAGFAVVPYPVDYRTGAPGDAWRPEASIASGLDKVDVAAREYIGLAAYWLAGRSSALYPGP